MSELTRPGLPLRELQLARLTQLRRKLMFNRVVTEPAFGSAEKAKGVLDGLREASANLVRGIPNLVAVLLAGSRIKGSATDESDIDMVLVKRNVNLGHFEERQYFLGHCMGFDRRFRQEGAGVTFEGLKVDFAYQERYVGSPFAQTSDLATEVHGLVALAARAEYFERIAERIRRFTSEELVLLTRTFNELMLDLNFRGEFRDDMVERIARKTGLTRVEVKGVFDAEFVSQRVAICGVKKPGEEANLLEKQMKELGEFVIS